MHYAEPIKNMENMWKTCQKDVLSLLSGQLVRFKIKRKGYEDGLNHHQRENAEIHLVNLYVDILAYLRVMLDKR